MGLLALAKKIMKSDKSNVKKIDDDITINIKKSTVANAVDINILETGKVVTNTEVIGIRPNNHINSEREE